MNWAARRRFMIIGGISLIGLTLLAVLAISIWYEAPSCTDGVQNHDEEGIDCGGSCTYLCSVGLTPPSTVFVRPVPALAGRTDVIAYIENKNRTAAVQDARYTVELYGEGNAKIAERTGTMDIPARAVVPLFVPDLLSGGRVVTGAFITFDQESLRWYTADAERTLPSVGSTEFIPGNAPRVTAVIRNATFESFYNVKFIATLFDAEDTAIAASQTVLREIPSRGEATAVFTWSAPFSTTPVRIEVIPVLPLP